MEGIQEKQEQLTEAEMWKELLEKTKKQLLYTRVLAAAAVGMFLIMLLAAVVVVPKASAALSQISDVMVRVQGLAENADSAVTGIQKMSGEVTAVSQSLNEFVTDNAQTLTEAAKDISQIDFEGLNQAIQDLQDAVSPLAKMMNRFK